MELLDKDHTTINEALDLVYNFFWVSMMLKVFCKKLIYSCFLLHRFKRMTKYSMQSIFFNFLPVEVWYQIAPVCLQEIKRLLPEMFLA